jgi:integrase/recombinase XerD
MTKANLLGPWVRRFLLEYLVSERNLARNTQRSYRDTLSLLLPFVAQQLQKEVDQISVIDVSSDVVRLFLRHLDSRGIP